MVTGMRKYYTSNIRQVQKSSKVLERAYRCKLKIQYGRDDVSV